MATPSSNIYWRKITANDRVQLKGHVFVVTTPKGKRAVAYWEGNESHEAQRYLMSRSAEHNPISTGGKVAIGAGVIAILAAIFWPKSAKADQGGGGTTPPGTTPPVTPPGTPPGPPATPPVGGTPADPPADDVSTFPTPPGALGGAAVIWQNQGTWVSKATIPLDASSIVNPTTLQPNLDLQALFAKLPMYVANPTSTTPPTYQVVRIYLYSGMVSPPWKMMQSFKNY